MKAIITTKYGPPEVLQLQEVAKPVPKDNEVLIRIYATTVTATDCTFRKGSPAIGRLFTGLTKPKDPIAGTELAGEIEAIGKDVKSFKVGDKVFGTTLSSGAYAEYYCMPDGKATLATMPTNMNYEEAVACDGYLTALPFLRDTGEIKSGQKVLINGASGSVGSSAVQLARHLGAEVTGVCSGANAEMVKSIGASHVIDYTKEDFTKTGQLYDLIFDTMGKVSFSKCKRALKPKGIYMQAALRGDFFPQALWAKLFSSKSARMATTGLLPPAVRTKNLVTIRGLMETGKIKPVIDRKWSLEQMAEAQGYVDKGHKKGNVVITIS